MEEQDSKKGRIGNFWRNSRIDPDIVIGLLLFASTFFVYLRLLAPTIFTGDSADATIASYTLGMPHPPGFPVYTWFGH